MTTGREAALVESKKAFCNNRILETKPLTRIDGTKCSVGCLALKQSMVSHKLGLVADLFSIVPGFLTQNIHLAFLGHVNVPNR